MKFSSTGQALQERVVHAGFWSVLLFGVGRMFGFVRTMIVARLLAPDDIGLFALVTLALIFVETLSKTGFQSALIHRQGDIVPDLNVAWTVHVFDSGCRRRHALSRFHEYRCHLFKKRISISQRIPLLSEQSDCGLECQYSGGNLFSKRLGTHVRTCSGLCGSSLCFLPDSPFPSAIFV